MEVVELEILPIINIKHVVMPQSFKRGISKGWCDGMMTLGMLT